MTAASGNASLHDCRFRECKFALWSQLVPVVPHTDLFEAASHQIRSNDDLKQTSESLRKALALSSNHNTVKAWQAMAAQEAAESNLGVACANLQVHHQQVHFADSLYMLRLTIIALPYNHCFAFTQNFTSI
jgi:hypothetical protein